MSNDIGGTPAGYVLIPSNVPGMDVATLLLRTAINIPSWESMQQRPNNGLMLNFSTSDAIAEALI